MLLERLWERSFQSMPALWRDGKLNPGLIKK